MDIVWFYILLLCYILPEIHLQLIINVKNQGGDVLQENITANVTEDTITLEFLRLDGVFVSQLVDFTNEVEAMKVVIPAEEELGQSGQQTLCFLTHAAQADFITPDAMAKLRQKNPGTVRVAEEDRGWRQAEAGGWAGEAVHLLSAPAHRHCAPAAPRVYLPAHLPPPRPGLEEALSSAISPFPERAMAGPGEGAPACGSARADEDCICHLEVCINWYPCGLKYCKGKPQGGLSYRCGIKTCRRCFRYKYYVTRRSACATQT